MFLYCSYYYYYYYNYYYYSYTIQTTTQMRENIIIGLKITMISCAGHVTVSTFFILRQNESKVITMMKG